MRTQLMKIVSGVIISLLLAATLATGAGAEDPPPTTPPPPPPDLGPVYGDGFNTGRVTNDSINASAETSRPGETADAPRVVSLAPSPYADCGFRRAPLSELVTIYFKDHFGEEQYQVIRDSAYQEDDDGTTVINTGGFFSGLLGMLHALSHFVNIPISQGTDFDTEYVLVDCPPTAVRQDLYVWQANDPPPATLVAAYRQQAYDETPIPVGGIGISPAGTPDVPLVVNYPTWLWTDASIWSPVTATAGIPGVVEVTTTATPSHVSWDPGTGHPAFTCNDPGTPWKPGLDESSATCKYLYQRSSAGEPGNTYTLTQTVTWTVTWTCEPACGGGTLPSIGIVDTTEVSVAEVQAVNT